VRVSATSRFQCGCAFKVLRSTRPSTKIIEVDSLRKRQVGPANGNVESPGTRTKTAKGTTP
jgi:hypothetical protein